MIIVYTKQLALKNDNITLIHLYRYEEGVKNKFKQPTRMVTTSSGYKLKTEVDKEEIVYPDNYIDIIVKNSLDNTLSILTKYDIVDEFIEIDDTPDNVKEKFITLLNIARVIKKDTIIHSDPLIYWKDVVNKHPFLYFKSCLFSTNKRKNKEGDYFLVSTHKDVPLGKKSAETCYGVVEIPPEPMLEYIKNKQYSLRKTSNMVASLSLTLLYNRIWYNKLMLYKEKIIRKLKNIRSEILVEDEVFSYIIQPVGLAVNVNKQSIWLRNILKDFKNNRDNSKLEVTYTDITDTFFTVNDKNKVILDPILVNSIKVLKIPITLTDTRINFKISFGLDIPPRNNLKRLENMNPEIWLVTWWESNSKLKYMTLIKTKDSIGIFTSAFSNSIYI